MYERRKQTVSTNFPEMAAVTTMEVEIGGYCNMVTGIEVKESRFPGGKEFFSGTPPRLRLLSSFEPHAGVRQVVLNKVLPVSCFALADSPLHCKG